MNLSLSRFLFLITTCFLLFFSCSKDDAPDTSIEDEPEEEVVLSNQNFITSFRLTINGEVVSGTISNSDNLITFETINAQLNNISPSIQISEKAKISPDPADAQDFNNDVFYTVEAEDRSTRTYTVRVNNTILSSDNLITSFKVTFDEFMIDAEINDENGSIYFEGGVYDISSLTPTIQVSQGASISPDGQALNFTTPVVYTVTAENGDEKVYTVTTNTPKIEGIGTVVGVFRSFPILLYTGAEILVSGKYLVRESEGAKLYLDDGTNTFQLDNLIYNDYSYENQSQILIETEIPMNIPTNSNYKLVYEFNEIRLESETFIDIVAENPPLVTSTNQETYKWNDVLTVYGENLPDMIAIPSNGNLFLIENSNNYDLTVNAERTELNVTLDYYNLFPSYYGREPETKIITPLGPNRRAGKPFRVVFE